VGEDREGEGRGIILESALSFPPDATPKSINSPAAKSGLLTSLRGIAEWKCNCSLKASKIIRGYSDTESTVLQKLKSMFLRQQPACV
jgi:hypothetical protein